MSHTIWLYWEGLKPPYISLCVKTVFAHNKNVVLLDRASFDHLFTQDRDIDIDPLGLVHKSDFIRAYLLKHYGGIYIDADCIVLRNLSDVLDMTQQFGFVGYRDPFGYMSCNFMASKMNGEVITEFYNRVCSAVRSKRRLEWLDIGSVPMDDVIACYKDRSFLLPTESVMPLSWNESEKLCVQRDDEEHEQYFRHDAFCYMLSNNTIKSRDETRILYHMTENQLLSDRYFISFLFRRSLCKES